MFIGIFRVFGIVSLLSVFNLQAEKPNILLVTVDDLNDWIEPLGGHPGAKTPSITAFCETGAVVFRNAVCPAPVCGPSRSAFLSGFMPNRSGIYGNGTNMRDSPLVQENLTMPEFFGRSGYYTLSTGKVFHGHRTEHGEDVGQWAFDTYFHDSLWDSADLDHLTDSAANLIDGKTPDPLIFDGRGTKGLTWGPTADPDFEKTKDFGKAQWASDYLSGKKSLKEPFFMAVGIYKPHVPWFVPQRFIDQHPLEKIEVPHSRADDLDSIKRANGKNVFRPQKDYEWVAAHGLENEAVRGYLAAVSAADETLGVILNQLAASKFAKNTIVVVMGDHGWHLGEKLRYHKQTLWAEAVRTPLIVRTPATQSAFGASTFCDNPVNLIDVFPTLIDLCGLEKKTNLDGVSFREMLNRPDVDTGGAAVTVSDKGASVLTRRWHYIENRSKGHRDVLAHEIYDLASDPYEANNLIGSEDPVVKSAIAWLGSHVPKQYVRSVAIRRKGKKRGLDMTIKDIRNKIAP